MGPALGRQGKCADPLWRITKVRLTGPPIGHIREGFAARPFGAVKTRSRRHAQDRLTGRQFARQPFGRITVDGMAPIRRDFEQRQHDKRPPGHSRMRQARTFGVVRDPALEIEEIEVKRAIGIGNRAGAAEGPLDLEHKGENFLRAQIAIDGGDRVDEPRLIGNRNRRRAPPGGTSRNPDAGPGERGERRAAGGARGAKDGRNVCTDAEKYQTIDP